MIEEFKEKTNVGSSLLTPKRRSKMKSKQKTKKY